MIKIKDGKIKSLADMHVCDVKTFVFDNKFYYRLVFHESNPDAVMDSPYYDYIYITNDGLISYVGINVNETFASAFGEENVQDILVVNKFDIDVTVHEYSVGNAVN